MSVDRRTLLKGGLGAAAVVALYPSEVLGAPLTTSGGLGAERRSVLFHGLRLVHADLHNHSHLSEALATRSWSTPDCVRRALTLQP